MTEPQQDPWQRVRAEVTGGRQWLDRAAVLAYAVASGLVVVGFPHLAALVIDAFKTIVATATVGRWLPLVWTPAPPQAARPGGANLLHR